MTWSRSRSQWRSDDLVVPAAALLIVDSFLPWYAVRWSITELDTGRTTEYVAAASAWSSSTGWSAGILLSLTAVAAWKIHIPSLDSPRSIRSVSVILAVAAVVVAALTWAVIPPTSASTSQALAFQPLPPAGTVLGQITRDALTARQTNVGTGFYVGIVLMIAILFALYPADRRIVPVSK